MHPHKPHYDRHAGTAKNKKFLKKISRERIDPRPVTPDASAADLIDSAFLSYNAGRLREGCQLFVKKMLAKNGTVGLALSGALTPAGLGMSCLVPLIEAGFIDWIVSTGANLYHDTHYALGMDLYQAGPHLPDFELRENQVIRIYDIVFDYENLLGTDKFFRKLCRADAFQQTMGTAEFHNLVGKYLAEREEQTGRGGKCLLAAAYRAGVPVFTSSPGDSSIGMNLAYHELINDGGLMVDPNRDVNEVCAIVLNGTRNGCVILGGGSPKNFYLQGQPTLWEVYGIPKGGNEYFIQITTDSVVWGGLSGATPAEAVSWGKVNPGVLPDTVVAYCDSTIAFPIFCEYAIGSANGRRPRKELVHRRDALVANLKREARAAQEKKGVAREQ